MLFVKNSYKVLFIFILFCISCDKGEVLYQIDEDFESYFCSYKDGSWWLLKDSATSTYDSLYVQDYKIKRESQGPRSNIYYEIIEYKLYSSGKISKAFCGVENSGSTCFGLKKVDLSTDYFSTFPSICKSSIIEDPNCYGCGFKMESSYQISSFVFTDVLKVWSQVDTFFYAKNVGLIQYINDTGNYCLVDYELN